MKCLPRFLPFFLLLSLCLPTTAVEFYVAVDGSPGNPGTEDSPWDITSAWSGQQKVSPGDTILMRGGVYRHPDRTWLSKGYEIVLEGTEAQPIHLRPKAGERVTIDGKVEVRPHARHLWVWDLEITVSETAAWNRRVTAGGLEPAGDVNLPAGGLNIIGGAGSKFINLVVHDMPNGVGFWRGAPDAEMHGCLVFGNGSIGPDRYHGPGIYTQNETGTKSLTDNILFGNYSTTIQAYGSQNAWVDGFRLIGNIAFAPVKAGSRAQVLVGGGRPSRDLIVSENLLYEIPLQIGYTAPHNEDAVVRSNLVVNAGMSINRFRQVVQEANVVLTPKATRPDRAADVFLRINRYDANRANLAIFNWQREPVVEVNLDPFLKLGDAYRIVNALDYFGAPVAAGVYSGNSVPVRVPVEERTGNGEFCAYVLFRSEGR